VGEESPMAIAMVLSTYGFELSKLRKHVDDKLKPKSALKQSNALHGAISH
jgi:hypothetical protein